MIKKSEFNIVFSGQPGHLISSGPGVILTPLPHPLGGIVSDTWNKRTSERTKNKRKKKSGITGLNSLKILSKFSNKSLRTTEKNPHVAGKHEAALTFTDKRERQKQKNLGHVVISRLLFIVDGKINPFIIKKSQTDRFVTFVD